MSAEVLYQTARSYLLDFYRINDPAKQRVALGLAMEHLASVLAKSPDHIPALRAKAVIHALAAELLYYDPNLAYTLAARVAKLEPHANAYLLNLSEWMSGEVRFTHETGHRVPHDPELGLNRSLELVESVMDNALPYSNEETAAFFLMGASFRGRGSSRTLLLYFEQVLERTRDVEQRIETLRELWGVVLPGRATFMRRRDTSICCCNCGSARRINGCCRWRWTRSRAEADPAKEASPFRTRLRRRCRCWLSKIWRGPWGSIGWTGMALAPGAISMAMVTWICSCRGAARSWRCTGMKAVSLSKLLKRWAWVRCLPG